MTKEKGVSFDGGPVGYGRPPAEHQFKKGNKPVGSGRRKESKNMATIAGELLNGHVTVTENGRKTRMTGMEALLRKAFAQAINGKMIDKTRFIDLLERYAPNETAAAPLDIRVRNIEGDDLE